MRIVTIAIGLMGLLSPRTGAGEVPRDDPPAADRLIRSAGTGPWSRTETWKGGPVPGAGAGVQVRAGHTVISDTESDRPVRSIHVAGTLRFDPDRDTRLVVGLIKIQAGDDASEDGFDCDAHAPRRDPDSPRPTLE